MCRQLFGFGSSRAVVWAAMTFGLLALFAPVASAQAQASRRPAGPGMGDAAPPIVLNALTNAPAGAKADWEVWGSGTVVIEFWGTWCPPCVASIPHLNELHDEFAPRGVRFLSVTFEPPEVVNRFRERIPIHTWVGHDMDRAMVSAYRVSGWPTTFVVRDGRILARTHPNALTRERLASWAGLELGEKGEVAGNVPVVVEAKPAEIKPVESKPVQARPDEKAEADSGWVPDRTITGDVRPMLEGDVHPGLDPYSVLTGREDPGSLLQVIVRRGGDEQWASAGDGQLTLLGTGIQSVVANVWGVEHYQVDVDASLADARFDVIYRVPGGSPSASMMSSVRGFVSAGLGVDIERELRAMDVYELRVSPGGLKLNEGSGWSVGLSMESDMRGARINLSNGRMDQLAGYLEHPVQRPVIDKTGLAGGYLMNLVLPSDVVGIAAALEAQAGLALVPVRTEIEVLVVRPDAGNKGG